jgi:hypothetical protein
VCARPAHDFYFLLGRILAGIDHFAGVIGTGAWSPVALAQCGCGLADEAELILIGECCGVCRWGGSVADSCA